MLFILPLLAVARAQVCDVYECYLPLTVDMCWAIDPIEQSVLVAPCANGLYCDTIHEENLMGFCSANPGYTRLPGEYCSSSMDCMSARCLGSGGTTCTGLFPGLTCKADSDCNPGLYCSFQGQCATQLAINSTCNYTAQCVNSAVCDFNVCVAYFSLGIGKATNVTMAPGLAPACQTGFANKTASGYVCATAPTSGVDDTPIACNVADLCYDVTMTYNKSCTCGLDGQGYCPLFEGDLIVTQMINSWKQLLPGVINNTCHTNNRLSYACFAGFSNQTLLSSYVNFALLSQLYFDDVWAAGALASADLCAVESQFPSFLNLLTQNVSGLPQCPVYSIVPASETQTQCIYYATNIFNSELMTSVNILYCNSSYYCNAVIGSNSSCVLNVVAPLAPGQNCSSGSDCSSGSCSGGFCTGLGLSANCTQDINCTQGLFCNASNVCAAVVPAGGQCNSSLPCQNTYLCDAGTCVKRFSVPQGQNTSIADATGFSMTCETGYALPNGTVFTCEIPPTSPSLGRLCQTSNDCPDTQNRVNASCVCGFDGNKYCNALPGDSPLQTAIAAFKAISSNASCSVTLGLSAGCFEGRLLDLLNYYYYETNMTVYQSIPYLQGFDARSVQETYLTGYFNGLDQIKQILRELYPNPGKKKSGAVLMGGVLAVLGMILV
jgi:hypothetical protein